MSKVFLFSVFLINCSCCLSQTTDTFIIDKWVNYNRPRGAGDNYGVKQEDRPYITLEGDTLVRRITLTAEFNQVRKEETLLHGQPNGITISYYPNGIVAEISYYLNGRIWNVISRADSSGKLYNPGTLRNGTGTRYFFSDFDREPNCYETYRDGLPEGPFYWQPTDDRAVIGELTYKKLLVKYIPAKKVAYTVEGGKVHTEIFDTSEFRNIFLTGDTSLRILKISTDSVEEKAKEYKYIDEGFGDPAIVPRGTWRVYNPKEKIPIVTVTFDDYGNPSRVTRYDPKGNILSKQSFPPYNRRIW